MSSRFIMCPRKSDTLISGEVSEDKFWLLIELSPIQSHKVICALYDYLVAGASRKVVCERHNVNNGYITRCMQKLTHIDRVVKILSSHYNQ
ncbi:transcriptional regulator [Escherichia coli]|uniref:PapB/FocB family fimbrial expression transcriptional regulator n=2 Tax=Escherichia coli TaxID=562 RepID=UPI0009078F11|nr:PapB/FocB family fimbrial expression transcriptional regulator [Escherichia coli]EET9655603.1 transcriptional regulator [Escherichia coli]EFI6586872.1 transcriptional regulator [Escherichia coli]EFM7837652.1 transcriptional regulator [Escherichia coli]EFP2087937.1 transcriptional regulator [Escherichia coli]EGB4669137.1 transcriptional regulator [Escherichia coli]